MHIIKNLYKEWTSTVIGKMTFIVFCIVTGLFLFIKCTVVIVPILLTGVIIFILWLLANLWHENSK